VGGGRAKTPRREEPFLVGNPDEKCEWATAQPKQPSAGEKLDFSMASPTRGFVRGRNRNQMKRMNRRERGRKRGGEAPQGRFVRNPIALGNIRKCQVKPRGKTTGRGKLKSLRYGGRKKDSRE